MPKVEVSVELSQDDYHRLKAALPPELDVDRIAESVARAGAMELLSQAAGKHVFSGIADLRLFRIYCLLTSGIDLEVADAIVAVLFKVPQATAKRWVRTALARYDVDLKKAFDSAIAKVLKSARWDERKQRWMVAIASASVASRVFELVDSLRLLKPSPEGKGSVWSFPDETLRTLCRSFGLPEPTQR
jgi:hypothetical protein